MTTDRKKVLFLLPSLAGGGAERVFTVLLRHLDRERFELHLGLLEAQGAYLESIPEDVILHHLRVSRVRYALPRIVSLIWRIRPQSILSTLDHLNLMLLIGKLLLPRGTKILVRESVIASVWLEKEVRYPKLWHWLYRHFYK